jgi:hypothetical protein
MVNTAGLHCVSAAFANTTVASQALSWRKQKNSIISVVLECVWLSIVLTGKLEHKEWRRE